LNVAICAAAIWILAMREMPDARQQREIEIGEGLAQAIGPRKTERKRKHGIALRPADAGRHRDCAKFHPRRSGASSVKRSARRTMTGSQVSQNSGQPCRQQERVPVPSYAA
jgi:hypothetical protein